MADCNIGQQLRSARNAMGLSTQQLAERLRLSVEKVELLEGNQFDKLSAPTYVAGYIRSYCHEVNLDAETFLNEYHQNNSVNQPALTSTSNQPEQIDIKDPRFISMTIAVLIVLMVLLGIWAWESLKVDNTRVYSDRPLPEIEAVFDESVADKQKPDANKADNVDSTVSDEEADVDQQNQTLIDSVETAEGLTEATEVEQQENGNVSEIPEDRQETISVQQDGKAPTGDDRLIIDVSDRSWVNIKDANGYRLYYDILNSDDSPYTMVGQAPFEVVLGDATVVKLSINDSLYSVERHIRADKSAKFSVK